METNKPGVQVFFRRLRRHTGRGDLRTGRRSDQSADPLSRFLRTAQR